MRAPGRTGRPTVHPSRIDCVNKRPIESGIAISDGLPSDVICDYACLWRGHYQFLQIPMLQRCQREGYPFLALKLRNVEGCRDSA
jgi:hypothetical protein